MSSSSQSNYSQQFNPYGEYENFQSAGNSDEAESSILHDFSQFDHQIEYIDHYGMPELLQPPPSPKHRVHTERNREEGQRNLIRDYFAERPTYNHIIFRRRFRMDRELFLRVVSKVEKHDIYFQQRPNAAGRLGLTALQKCTAAMRQLAYGTAPDAVDEYLRIAECTARHCLSHFCNAVIEVFGEKYLRRPSSSDLDRLKTIGEARGFPGMLGSIDCMHWEWKNCPAAYKGQYQGRSGDATLILEAVASADLWIWHAFFGTPGSLNDINVLHRSHLFDDILNGIAPKFNYKVNGKKYKRGYYLTDGIYLKWSTFIPAYANPQTEEHILFTGKQEEYRKDVERAFGVLQARFAVLRKPALAWTPEILDKIMTTCIILHNMIVEDERPKYAHFDDMSEFWADKPVKPKPRPGEPIRTDWIEQDEDFSWRRKTSAINSRRAVHVSQRGNSKQEFAFAIKRGPVGARCRKIWLKIVGVEVSLRLIMCTSFS